MYPVELSISQTISSPHAWVMASSGGNGGLVVTLKKYSYYVSEVSVKISYDSFYNGHNKKNSDSYLISI